MIYTAYSFAAYVATQMALDAALQATPDPLVIESDSDAAWQQWDAAQRAADRSLLLRADARHDARRFTGTALTGWGSL